MRIYTRTGDDGTTGLTGGGRVGKDDSRIRAYGAVDELNAQLGVCRAAGLPAEAESVVAALQHEMFALGAELASPSGAVAGMTLLGDADVLRLETAIDRFERDLAPLRHFILPGGTGAAAALHVARCVCRRAEGEMVALSRGAAVRGVLLAYVNRVSDLLFVLARWCNQQAGVADTAWEKS
jgi:cob(I)alamin adenosyltransferase